MGHYHCWLLAFACFWFGAAFAANPVTGPTELHRERPTIGLGCITIAGIALVLWALA